jgi:hypothetical protein
MGSAPTACRQKCCSHAVALGITVGPPAPRQQHYRPTACRQSCCGLALFLQKPWLCVSQQSLRAYWTLMSWPQPVLHTDKTIAAMALAHRPWPCVPRRAGGPTACRRDCSRGTAKTVAATPNSCCLTHTTLIIQLCR